MLYQNNVSKQDIKRALKIAEEMSTGEYQIKVSNTIDIRLPYVKFVIHNIKTKTRVAIAFKSLEGITDNQIKKEIELAEP